MKKQSLRSTGSDILKAEGRRQKAHINWLAEEDYISLAGRFGDNGEIRGILVFHTATMEEAEELASRDPSVQAGRLVVEIHPWWAAKGSVLK